MKTLLLFILNLLVLTLNSQSNIRAWYADGQVWILWKIKQPIPRTVGVYASPVAFSSVNEASLIGRSYELDYLPTALKEQFDPEATFTIPDGNTGTYALARDEGLFVFTPHQAGSLYFAVVSWGDTQVIQNDNITNSPVEFKYDPVNDPVECHRQAIFPSPFAPGFLCASYYMWVDGRDNFRDGRPDFPVMANAAKNGMPGFFLISVHNSIDTSKPFPLTIWLHGGGGNSHQSLPGSRKEININPQRGMLLAHNDDVFGIRDSVPAYPENPSWHFGWRNHWDPFSLGNLPTQTDTIINYTQRRYLWIDNWLMRQFNIDPSRIHINGHSMGSAGATMLGKAYPNHYASVTVFNNGFSGHEEGTAQSALLGPPSQNFPTNLIKRNGETVHILELSDIIHNVSPERDLPVFRSYHGKNDDNGTMRWDEYVVENYRTADSMGYGMHLFWSERPHGVDMAPSFNDHWIMGMDPTSQTATDNVNWEESHFATNISYPAFYNHRLEPNANDPGDGTLGTGPNGVGDDWGTWGGWHRWDNLSILDESKLWSVEAWLESNAVFLNDNCPHQSLTADLAIRRPQQFHPTTGTMINWKAEDASTSQLLQQGNAIVDIDNLVHIPGIILYPESIRKVKISISSLNVPVTESKDDGFQLMLTPSPSKSNLFIKWTSGNDQITRITIINSYGIKIFDKSLYANTGINNFNVIESFSWNPGMYFVTLSSGTSTITSPWLKL